MSCREKHYFAEKIINNLNNLLLELKALTTECKVHISETGRQHKRSIPRTTLRRRKESLHILIYQIILSRI